jgi:hypothetical protein
MKKIGEMSVEELGGLVCQTLAAAGITVTLTGGACVAIWSEGKYVSHDLDFIEEGPVARRKVTESLKPLGFEPVGRHFVNSESPFIIEFPTGPLMVGNERVQDVNERMTPLGTLRLLSPTDCVKDRLAAYFHWNDRQSLEQACLVAKAQKVKTAEIRRWAIGEACEAKFRVFERELRKKSRRRSKRTGAKRSRGA